MYTNQVVFQEVRPKSYVTRNQQNNLSRVDLSLPKDSLTLSKKAKNISFSGDTRDITGKEKYVNERYLHVKEGAEVETINVKSGFWGGWGTCNVDKNAKVNDLTIELGANINIEGNVENITKKYDYAGDYVLNINGGGHVGKINNNREEGHHDSSKINISNEGTTDNIIHCGDLKLTDKARVGKVKILQPTSYCADSIIDLKKSSHIDFIESNNLGTFVTLNDNSTIDKIKNISKININDNSKVAEIEIDSTYMREIKLSGSGKVEGQINFVHGRGVVIIEAKNGVYPQIKESQINGGIIQKIKEAPVKPQPPTPKKGFEKVAGMDELKETLRTDVIDPLKKPELYAKYGLTPINGVMLYGPPGCGKTYIAEALAEETGRSFIEIRPSDVGSSFMHETAKNIKEKFENAIAKKPSIIFIDEIESIAPSREGLGGDACGIDVNEQVTELLTQLNNCAKNNIFVISATNEPQKMDRAILRTGRFDKKIFVGSPDEKARKGMLQQHMENRYKDEKIDYNLLAQKTKEYSASDIKALTDQAARIALTQQSPIKAEHFDEAKKSIPPSLPENLVERYRRKIDDLKEG